MSNKIQPKETARKYVRKLILPSDPLAPMWNAESVIFHKKPKWNYIDNCVITALLMMYDKTGEKQLLLFVDKTDAEADAERQGDQHDRFPLIGIDLGIEQDRYFLFRYTPPSI